MQCEWFLKNARRCSLNRWITTTDWKWPQTRAFLWIWFYYVLFILTALLAITNQLSIASFFMGFFQIWCDLLLAFFEKKKSRSLFVYLFLVCNKFLQSRLIEVWGGVTHTTLFELFMFAGKTSVLRATRYEQLWLTE